MVDAQTGQVLYSKNADALRYPASLTKMMTLYLTFEALKDGKLDLKQTVSVSGKAAAQPQTNIALDRGERLPLRTAIESIVVRSANDSAMVLGEALGGTEFNFALLMSKKARELGMKNTVFRNPSGLPDNKQHTTAFDMARLAIALRRDFPDYYHYFSMSSFTYNGVTYPGHNHVMERYPGVDGVKTGFIRASGYNLVTSAERDGHRIVAVIMGGSTITARDNQMIFPAGSHLRPDGIRRPPRRLRPQKRRRRPLGKRGLKRWKRKRVNRLLFIYFPVIPHSGQAREDDRKEERLGMTMQGIKPRQKTYSKSTLI